MLIVYNAFNFQAFDQYHSLQDSPCRRQRSPSEDTILRVGKMAKRSFYPRLFILHRKKP